MSVEVNTPYLVRTGVDKATDGLGIAAKNAHLLPKIGMHDVLHGLVELVVGHYGNQGTKLLLVVDPHGGRHPREHGGAVKRCGMLCSARISHLRSMGKGVVDHGLKEFYLAVLGQGRDFNLGIPRRAPFKLLHGGHQAVHKLVVKAAVHPLNLEGRASLTVKTQSP